MVADASIWRLAEATGSRWKFVEASGRNSRKNLEVSVESMEVFATSMEGLINLHEQKHFIEENNFNIRETC